MFSLTYVKGLRYFIMSKSMSLSSTALMVVAAVFTFCWESVCSNGPTPFGMWCALCGVYGRCRTMIAALRLVSSPTSYSAANRSSLVEELEMVYVKICCRINFRLLLIAQSTLKHFVFALLHNLQIWLDLLLSIKDLDHGTQCFTQLD